MKSGVRRALRAAGISARATARFLGRVVGFLAASAGTSAPDDELGSSIRGGVLNYRTGKLDDGTDPYGWYERD